MTAVESLDRSIPMRRVADARLDLVDFDLYRDVHKGLRSGLFGLTTDAGTVDPADAEAVGSLAARLDTMIDLLDDHALHEEEYLGPVIERLGTGLAERVAHEHCIVEQTMSDLRRLADGAARAAARGRRSAVHRLYLTLAGFTSEYLAHLATEEVEVMPSLAAVIPPAELIEVNQRIVSGISPGDMEQYLRLILPAQNPADRLDMAAGMRADMPKEAFAGVLLLAGEVLTVADADRLQVELVAGR